MQLTVKHLNRKLKAKILLIQIFVLIGSVAFAQGTNELIHLYEEQIHLLRIQLAIAVDVCFIVSGVTILTVLYFWFENHIDNFLVSNWERINNFIKRLKR